MRTIKVCKLRAKGIVILRQCNRTTPVSFCAKVYVLLYSSPQIIIIEERQQRAKIKFYYKNRVVYKKKSEFNQSTIEPSDSIQSVGGRKGH